MSPESANLRVIKPYKRFYNILMSILLKFGIPNLLYVSVADIVEALQHTISDIWRPELSQPAETFCGWCKYLLMKKPTCGTAEFFENLKCQMLQAWDSEVVFRASAFHKHKATI